MFILQDLVFLIVLCTRSIVPSPLTSGVCWNHDTWHRYNSLMVAFSVLAVVYRHSRHNSHQLIHNTPSQVYDSGGRRGLMRETWLFTSLFVNFLLVLIRLFHSICNFAPTTPSGLRSLIRWWGLSRRKPLLKMTKKS